MDDRDSEWQGKGATLSDKTARKEFGLRQDEIVQAIRAGKLRYRLNSVFGNPFLRLLRREVEALVKKKHGGQLPVGSEGEGGAGEHQPRAEAAPDQDGRVGSAEVTADRRPRTVTASALLSNEERER